MNAQLPFLADEAERAALGAALVNLSACALVCRDLLPTDFYRDRELLRDVSAAADVLAMGPDGIAIHVSLRLRSELLAAARELAQRWHMDGPA